MELDDGLKCGSSSQVRVKLPDSPHNVLTGDADIAVAVLDTIFEVVLAKCGTTGLETTGECNPEDGITRVFKEFSIQLYDVVGIIDVKLDRSTIEDVLLVNWVAFELGVPAPTLVYDKPMGSDADIVFADVLNVEGDGCSSGLDVCGSHELEKFTPCPLEMLGLLEPYGTAVAFCMLLKREGLFVAREDML